MFKFVLLSVTTSIVYTTLVCPLNLFAQDKPDESIVVDSILTPEAAFQASLRYTGFTSDKELTPSASAISTVKVVLMVDSTTPFVSADIDGRSAWRVEYPRFILHLDTVCERLAQKRPKTACVFLDNPSGKFLTAIITDDATDLHLDRRPTSEEAEHLLSVLGEKYVGLPDSPPSIDLLTALKQCKGAPVGAKEIIVSYVLYSCKDWGPSPAWIIFMRGLRPWTASTLVPDYVRTNMRCVVDALTGELIFTNNVPYPQLSKDTAGADERDTTK